MDPEVDGAPNVEARPYRMRRGRSFRRYRAVARRGPERLARAAFQLKPPRRREAIPRVEPAQGRKAKHFRFLWLLVPLAALAVAGGIRVWQRYGPVPIDPALEQAIVAGDWAQVLSLAEAWQMRDPAALTPALVADEACTRLGEPGLRHVAKRYLTHAEARDRPELWSCVRWARTLVRHQPGCSAAHCLAASALIWVGEYSAALKAADEAIRLVPVDARPYELRAAAHTFRHEYDEALADAAKAVELAPRDALAYATRAYVFYDRQEYDRAIADYTTEIGLNPRDAEAYADRGIAYDANKEFDQAIADFTRAIELDPQSARARSLRASDYARKGEFTKARAEWDAAIELDPTDWTAYRERGYLIDLKRGWYAEAIRDFTKAIELDQWSAAAYAGRGYAYGKLYYYERSVEDYDRATRLDPWDADIWYRLGIAHGRNHSHGAAVSDFTKAIELDPNNADAYASRAWAHCNVHMFERALTDADRAIALDPRNTEAHYERGAALRQTGRRREAIMAFREALYLAITQHLDITADDARNELRKLGAG
jgi:tetratricopeptide (TPR) repeat protein